MPSCLSSSRPAEGWHKAFTIGCGGLGPGGEGCAHRIGDLMSAESLSGRLGGLLRDRRHQGELEPREKSAAEAAPVAAAIGGPEARVWPGNAEPSAATCGHAPPGPCIGEGSTRSKV